MSDVVAAAAELARARREGITLPGLPDAMKPATLQEAEEVQIATLAETGETIGGWKVGRNGPHLFTAPMPVIVASGDDGTTVTLPAGAGVELEIALVFRQTVPASDFTVPGLPESADLAVLFELCVSRFGTAQVTPFERIADCASNHSALVRAFPRSWTLAELERPGDTRLLQDGVEIAHHARRHPSMPLTELLEGWAARIRHEDRTIWGGEVVTLGSLVGMIPVPAGGAEYVGTIAGLGTLRCRVTTPRA
ncbi:hypothetical protein [Muricoccus radiodurans]|uniref:hypothetical protein n=1 Tax=Muricoccus radiodurans TaxID=2231721 RepID=UPI003CEDA3A0